MLQTLCIQNIILIERAEIGFEKGFHAISGETGAGKSAVILALGLVAGTRSDTSMIRAGAEKGVVEALFDPDDSAKVRDLLDEAGIEACPHESLVIRRELQSSGRSRAFINDQLVTLALLKSVGGRLIELVNQHASQELRELEGHRRILDLFGGHQLSLNAFAEAWRLENQLRAERDLLVRQESERLRERESCRLQRDELQAAAIREGEEEALFSDYTRLSHAEELLAGVEELSRAIGGEENSVLTLLSQQKPNVQRLSKLDLSLQELDEAYQRVLCELQEMSYLLSTYLGRIECNPERLATINERLTLMSRLKKKYGPSMLELLAYQTQLEHKLAELENADVRLESLQLQLQQAEQLTQRRAEELTAQRKAAAERLEEQLVVQLAALNMPKVRVETRLTPQKRTSHGDDLVEIFFTPNAGERLLPLQESASGGELSRFLLALKAILAEKEAVSTLVFDEIDANIGGETALIVGRKLAEIGQSCQVLCITHFPQVARLATSHLHITKQEHLGRTLTCVRTLEGAEREGELLRMIGQT